MSFWNTVITSIFIGILIILLIAGLGCLLAFPIKWTWNAVIPHILGLPTITWGKAWCLHFICSSLIKSIHTHK
jgi:hypothetical protein